MRSHLLAGAFIGGTVAGLIAAASIARAAEEHEERTDVPVAKKDLPAAVVATATRFADGLELDHAVLADEDGVQVYELDYKGGRRALEVQTSQSGELFATEEKIAESDAPALVRERAAKLFAAGSKVRYERTLAVVYEVAIKDAHGKEVEYLVNQAGAAFQEVAPGIKEGRR